MSLNDLPTFSEERFIETITSSLEEPKPILVCNNDFNKIIEALQKVTKANTDWTLYHQINPFLSGNTSEEEFINVNNCTNGIEAFKNTVKKDFLQVRQLNKQLINLSTNSSIGDYKEYPADIKMILFVENFNFWDVNSQVFITGQVEKSTNILPVCQIRSDFDFAKKNIDMGLRTKKYNCQWMNLE